jgi:hypothetical protein
MTPLLIGQGERYQSLDFEHDHETFASVSYRLETPHPRVRFLPTTEHTLMGVGCILLGTNTAQYRIWDGMRAIDYLMGNSFVGMRTTDVFRWSDYLSRYGSNEEPLPIQLIATGEAAVPALHAAALQPSRFEKVRLKRMIRSWAEVVAAPESLNQLVNSVHGALRHYDLPELVELAGKERVKIEQPVDASGRQED